MREYNFTSRNCWLLAVMLACLVAGAVLYFAFSDQLRSPEGLYQTAQNASPERAARLYRLMGQKLPQIETYTRLWAAEALEPDEETLLELQRIAASHPGSAAAYHAYIAIARRFGDSKTYEAQGAYRAALELNDDAALRLELARTLEWQGDFQGAYQVYRSLLKKMPDAFAGIRRTSEDPLSLAEDFLEATYYSDVLDVLRDVEDPEALPLRAQALLGLERYVEAEGILREWLAIEPEDTEAQIDLASALTSLGRPDEAQELYRGILTNDSRLALATLLEAVDPDEAVSIYLESPYPVAWWNATWILEDQGRLEEVLPVYRRLAESGAYFADDAAYRLYVLGDKSGDQETRTLGEDLLQGMGTNWLALRALDEELTFPGPPAIEKAGELVLERALALESLGREDLAYMELLLPARSLQEPVLKLSFLDALASRGHFMEAVEIAEAYLGENPDAGVDFWRLSYPRPYREAVESAASEYGIDPLLLWAVMRVESRYDPNALSAAGARGLMQVLPETQAWIAGQLEKDIPPGDAYDAGTSIQMGAWYLHYLLDYFDGDQELAILAYNGGAANVEAWLEDARVESREDLIRWIGFGETREYLERVSLAYLVYQALYAGEAGSPPGTPQPQE